MPRYRNRKTGTPVDAIQFTGPESAHKIAAEFNVHIEYHGELGTACMDGVWISRGQYAVMRMVAIVVVDSKRFNALFKLCEVQEELF